MKNNEADVLRNKYTFSAPCQKYICSQYLQNPHSYQILSHHHYDEIEIKGLEEIVAKNSGRFGDRRCHLTVIGDKTQVDWFTESLQRCFLTENEIEHWKSGGTFPDPWPNNYVTREC